MLRKLSNQLKYKQKGFTLIELLVVVAILGVLAAVAIPNVAKFISYGRDGVGDTEFREIQSCVVALLADNPATTDIASSMGSPTEFGNTTRTTGDTRQDLTIDSKNLSSYITGGIIKCLGHYRVDLNGNVTQLWYPAQ